MSLSWLKRKHLRIGLGAQRVMVSGAKAVELEAADDWRAALDALPGILGAHKAREASVVLADQFVRYALLPWNQAVKSREQWLALARHRFGALHGAAAAAWDVKLAETAPLGPRLACAVDRELVEALVSNFVTQASTCARWSPSWWRRSTASARWWATARAGSWSRSRAGSRWRCSSAARGSRSAAVACDARWRSALPEILERESAFLGLDQACTRVIVCAQGEFDAQMHDAWRAQAMSYRDLALAWE